MALLPVPSMPPPMDFLGVTEVHLLEAQALPNVPVFDTGAFNNQFQHRQVPEAAYQPRENGHCLGVTVDAGPRLPGFDPVTQKSTNPSMQRVAVAIDGVVSLLCPSNEQSSGTPGAWVYVTKDQKSGSQFRGYPGKLPKLQFDSQLDKDRLEEKIYIGRLLIKDEMHNIVTVDLCPW